MARRKIFHPPRRRTTVDIPILLHAQMARAAWDQVEAKDEPWPGMFRRWLEEAVREKLERSLNRQGEPYWPPSATNLPPQSVNPRPPRPPVPEYQPSQEELDAEERRRRLELGNVVRPRALVPDVPAIPARAMPDAFDPSAERDEPPEDAGTVEDVFDGDNLL